MASRQTLSDRSGEIVAKRVASDVRQWAVMGAEARLLQISEEAAAIYRAFPELRRGGRGGARGRRPAATQASARGEDASPGGGTPRRRPPLGAAARQRLSGAPKKRRAEHRP